MRILIILALIIFIVSCNKNENEIHCGPKYYPGNSTCNSNYAGIEWRNAASYFYCNNYHDLNSYPNYSIKFFISDNNCNMDVVTIKNLPKRGCKFKLEYSLWALASFPSAVFHSNNGGDATAEIYDLIEEGFDNWVSIESINKDSTELTGRFNLGFVLSKETPGRGLYDPNMPDTLYFRDGTFRSIINKK